MAAPRSGPATTRKKIRGFKQSTYAGVGCFTANTLIEYVRDGKRAGTKSAERYNVYAEAKTFEHSLSLGSRVADLLNDFEKGILLPAGGLVRREDVSADQFAAMSKLDRVLYNFARKARGEKPRSALMELEPLRNIQVWRFALYYFFVFGAFVALALDQIANQTFPMHLVEVVVVDR